MVTSYVSNVKKGANILTEVISYAYAACASKPVDDCQ